MLQQWQNATRSVCVHVNALSRVTISGSVEMKFAALIFVSDRKRTMLDLNIHANV